MAKLLNCKDVELECDFLCAETEDQLVNRADQHARLNETGIEMPGEFEDRVRSLIQTIDHC
jgi:predicted small metal-binding protein